MSRNSTIHLLRLTFAGLLLSLATTTARAETNLFDVQLASGRTFQGTISSRTDESRLWLQFGTKSTQMLRPIHWNRVVLAKRGDQDFTADEFRQLAIASALQGKVNPPKKPRILQIKRPASEGQPTHAELATQAIAEPARVTHINVDAVLSNWDADVEQDGLLVDVAPLDAYGQVVATRGTVEVTLIAPQHRRFIDAPRAAGVVRGRIGHWTETVDWQEGQFGQLQLPFQALHPEFNTRIGTHGLVHVRMTIPGAGVFEQTVELVRIRPFSPIRDAQQRASGQRFFPGERTR
jgi:hypothetical protein